MKWKSWWKEESDACTWPGERSQLSAEMRERVILMDNATIYNESQASLPVRKEPELGNEYWTTLKWPAGMQAALRTMCTQWTPSQNAALWGESMNMLNHVSSIWGLKLNLYTLRTVTVINQISLVLHEEAERKGRTVTLVPMLMVSNSQLLVTTMAEEGRILWAPSSWMAVCCVGHVLQGKAPWSAGCLTESGNGARTAGSPEDSGTYQRNEPVHPTGNQGKHIFHIIFRAILRKSIPNTSSR